MNVLIYYGLVIPLSRLPYFFLYRLSDVLFFIMYYLVGYRKKVVFNNIKNSFPELSKREHQQIMRKFYRHFYDLVLEALKGFTISEKQLNNRFRVIESSVVDRLYNEGKDVIFVGGHYNNWEMLALGVSMQMNHLLIGIYKPLRNAYFDEKMRVSRQRFGMVLCSMKQTRRFFEDKFDKPKGIIFAIDQSPSNPATAYWTDFLNQDTAMFYGAEKYAKEFNTPVVYGVIHKRKRGYYEAEFRLVTEYPNEMAYGEIISKSNKMLEEDIRLAPQYWLWTHKRWKHKRKKD